VGKERRQSLLPALLDLGAWHTTGSAVVRKAAGGIVLYLPDALSMASYTLSEVGQRKASVHVSLVPINASFGSLRFSLREGNREAAVTAYLQGNLVPASVWTVAMECGDGAELFFQGGASPLSEFYLAEAWVS
jgi:hypothetical protein